MSESRQYDQNIHACADCGVEAFCWSRAAYRYSLGGVDITDWYYYGPKSTDGDYRPLCPGCRETWRIAQRLSDLVNG